jgi:hypothetical protein
MEILRCLVSIALLFLAGGGVLVLAFVAEYYFTRNK